MRDKKKLHHFIFAIALSELHLLRQFLAHIYFSKFPIACVFRILHVIRDRKTPYVLKVQMANKLCTHRPITTVKPVFFHALYFSNFASLASSRK